MAKVKDLKKGILKGDKKSIARSISLVENGSDDARKLLKSISKKTGNSHIIGVTGVGGSGKSTLISKVIGEYRERGLKVGVLAVDPSSPYTGGALLGDRVRMEKHFTDDGVFIRSMATRGQLGGLAREAYNAAKILDAAGFEKVIIETIGIGQDEVDIVKVADTSIVVVTPGYGDDIQALKAGMMEIADIFVVNKADKEGADKTRLQLEMNLHLGKGGKKPEIHATVATESKGVGALVEGIEGHFSYLKKESLLGEKRKERVRHELYNILNSEIMKIIGDKVDIGKAVDDVYKKRKDPYSVVEKALKKLKR